ncbi:MAG: DUF882 domain-containing protein [Terricaulis sp.]
MNRRDLLRWSGAGLAACATTSITSLAHATAPSARTLSLVNTHTGESFSDAFWENGAYVPDALAAINGVMRDHRSGEVHTIDSRLLDMLSDLKLQLGATAPYQIISGYRSPTTNAAMHAASSGVRELAASTWTAWRSISACGASNSHISAMRRLACSAAVWAFIRTPISCTSIPAASAAGNQPARAVARCAGFPRTPP